MCRYGWLGLNQDVPSHEILNYVGVTLCLIRYHLYLSIILCISPVLCNHSPLCVGAEV